MICNGMYDLYGRSASSPRIPWGLLVVLLLFSTCLFGAENPTPESAPAHANGDEAGAQSNFAPLAENASIEDELAWRDRIRAEAQRLAGLGRPDDLLALFPNYPISTFQEAKIVRIKTKRCEWLIWSDGNDANITHVDFTKLNGVTGVAAGDSWLDIASRGKGEAKSKESNPKAGDGEAKKPQAGNARTDKE